MESHLHYGHLHLRAEGAYVAVVDAADFEFVFVADGHRRRSSATDIGGSEFVS